MKWIVWMLLLVNALLFGYFELKAPSPASGAGTRDLAAGKIRILTPEQLASMARPAPPPDPALVQNVPAPAAQLQAAPVPAICYEWGSFAEPEAVLARQALDRLALNVITRKNTPQEAIRYWVYIPPLKTPEAALAKAEEVRSLGVQETFIIQDPKWRNAISLGVFREEALANRLLEDLRNRGVRSAVKGQRNLEGDQTGYYIRNMTPAQQEELNKLKPDFPGSDLKLVDCK